MKKMVSLMMSATLMLSAMPVQVYAEDIQDITEASTETILLQETQATETLSDVEREDVLVTQPETEEIDLPAETEQESETEGVALPESERMTEEDTEPVSESAYTEDEELIIEEGTDISYGIEQIDLENMGVMAAEEVTCDGVSGEFGIHVLAESEPSEVYSTPENAKLNDLWVGDIVRIGFDTKRDLFNSDISSVEILDGSDFLSIENKYGIYTCYCIKAGTAKIKVNFSEATGKEPGELTLTIKERTAPIKIEMPESIKLGEFLRVNLANLPYNVYPSIELDHDMGMHFTQTNGWGGGGTYEFKRDEANYWIFMGIKGEAETWVASSGTATYPGTINATICLPDHVADLYPQKTCSLRIEEPIIETNVDANVKVGSTDKFQVFLKNTAYRDKAITSLDQSDYIYYTPQIEVMEGADCIAFKGNAQLTTLSLTQDMEYVKTGTVKLKICFVPNESSVTVTDDIAYNIYQPEKIITINVVDELETEAPETEPQKQTEAPAAEVKVSSVKITTSDLSVQKGKTLQLTTAVVPENAKNKALVWSSSDTSIATVNDRGVVTGKKYGTATITAKAADGSGKSVQCKVKVGYGITYKLNSGKNSAKNPRAYYKSTVKLQNPTRKGYLFKGWYTDKKYKKKITKIASSSKKNLTLYAKWEKVKTGKAAISSLKNAKGKKATLKFKKVSKASGYEILYGTAKNLKGAKTVTSKKTTVTLKGLTKGKTYYVKVRAYRTDSAGSKVYGKYSGVKRVKITK